MTKTVKVKANGKINFGLNVLGREGEFHSLDTVMWEINLYDEIVLSIRRDDKINLDVKGCNASDIAAVDNNAYKAAKAFMERFGTHGCDIRLKKNIPIGSGLGGSSADIVGTIKAMAKAYKIDEDLLPLISSMCSDGEFLLSGGCARIKGRGEVFEVLQPRCPMFLIIAVPEGGSVTRDVFMELDRGAYAEDKADMDLIASYINDGRPFVERYVFNALLAPAKALNGEIEGIYNKLLDLSPDFISMSGSGSAVFGVYSSIELCRWAKTKMDEHCLCFVTQTKV